MEERSLVVAVLALGREVGLLDRTWWQKAQAQTSAKLGTVAIIHLLYSTGIFMLAIVWRQT